jgi:hypothetical protein
VFVILFLQRESIIYMTDYIIRSAFHQSILKFEHECSDTFVVDELGLKNGLVRADIAVLNGKLVGYEIKTDKDTLARLPNQVKAYNEVFDNVYIITGNRHLANVLASVPNWWGVYLITETKDGSYKFRQYRKAKKNWDKNTFGLAQLLWKDEVIDILTSTLNHSVKSKSTKDDLYEILSAECSPNRLSMFVLKYLKSRQTWRTNLQLLS